MMRNAKVLKYKTTCKIGTVSTRKEGRQREEICANLNINFPFIPLFLAVYIVRISSEKQSRINRIVLNQKI